MTVSWSASTGATSYAIWKASVSGGPYLKVGTSSSTSYSNTGLHTATTYYYVVTAVGPGGASGYSSEASGTTN